MHDIIALFFKVGRSSSTCWGTPSHINFHAVIDAEQDGKEKSGCFVTNRVPQCVVLLCYSIADVPTRGAHNKCQPPATLPQVKGLFLLFNSNLNLEEMYVIIPDYTSDLQHFYSAEKVLGFLRLSL